MTRVIVSTSIRETPHDVVSGRIFVIDLESRQILRSSIGVEPPHREQDVNPRGGMRGMRGMGIYNGELAVANFSSVLFFDRSWNFVRAVTHPAVASIHEINYSERGLWVTGTANDVLAHFDAQGGQPEFYCLRELEDVMAYVGGSKLPPLSLGEILNGGIDFRQHTLFKSDKYDHLHANAMCYTPDGRMLVSLGLIVGSGFTFQMRIKTMMMKLNLWSAFLKLNIFVRRLLGLQKTMLSELVVQPARGYSAVTSLELDGRWDVCLHLPVTRNPSHSVRAMDDGSIIYLLTSFGEIAHFDRNGTLKSRTKVTDQFLRGLLVLPDNKILVGASNILLLFDLEAQQVLAEIKLSENVLETIFDIHFLPDDFDLPPASLQAVTGCIKGFEGNQVIWDRSDNADTRSHS